jgi:alpha,alpha-trehalose phosphorylase
MASLAGTWIGAVAGFGGMRDHDGILSFTPRLPQGLVGLRFRLSFRGRRLLVEVHSHQVTYSLLDGPPLQIVHHGESVTVDPERALTQPIPPPPVLETPSQPRGREPTRRRRPA